MQKKNIVLICTLIVVGMFLAVISSLTVTSVTVNSTNITMADDEWIGLGGAAGRIIFDDQATDEIEIINAKVGIGTNSPTVELHVLGDAEITGELGVDNGGFVVDSTNHRVGINDNSPARKLEIIDDTDTPQLRLTDFEDTDYTDFHTMTNGFLLIQPSGNKVGIATTNEPVATLDVNGGLAMNIVTEDDDYTATSSDYTILADAGIRSVNITLPSASSNTGQIFIIKRIDAPAGGRTIAIYPSGSDNLDQYTSASPKTLGSQWDSIMVQSNGSDWFIIAD
jgi:hypothetical protein